MQGIAVIGSLNVDLTVQLPRFHQPGETIIGDTFHTYAGGKGGNQAVACAKLGAPVEMIGCLGRDGNGDFYRQTLAAAGVGTGALEAMDYLPTGVALIEVDRTGENRIAVVPGANSHVSADQLVRAQKLLDGCRVALLQLEIPLDTVIAAATQLRQAGKTVILDPAPAQPLPDVLLGHTDYITPNETELGILCGQSVQTLQQARQAAQLLLNRGPRAVVAKLGAKGCLYVSREQTLHVPGFRVQVVDTTAAGDSFNAGLAVALERGLPLLKALRFANAVGALSTTGAGAQGAMPSLRQVEALLQSQP